MPSRVVRNMYHLLWAIARYGGHAWVVRLSLSADSLSFELPVVDLI